MEFYCNIICSGMNEMVVGYRDYNFTLPEFITNQTVVANNNLMDCRQQVGY